MLLKKNWIFFLNRWMLIFLMFFIGINAYAYKDKSFYGGVGYYSQNTFYRVTTSPDASKNLMGTSIYPLVFKYDWSLYQDWFLSPTFTYTLMPRSSSANSAEVTIWHMILPFGTNLSSSSEITWDWFVGPGLINYEIKGAGGTKDLSNGTGTATFAVPGGSSKVRNFTFNIGGAFNYQNSRVGLDLITEGFLSSEKRTYSIMLSYVYRFSEAF